MAFRAALHQAGAASLSQLLQFPEPAFDQRTLPCPCGSQARYRELRSRRMLTVLGASLPGGLFRQLDSTGRCSKGARNQTTW